MRATRLLLLQQRQPMIRFVGKRSSPAHADHSPHVHPASPSDHLPETFASYRKRAQQHGPLGPTRSASTSASSRSGASLGTVQPSRGEYFDRSELPARFKRTPFSLEEIDAIETGGASLHS